jgi:hypothetical protein
VHAQSRPTKYRTSRHAAVEHFAGGSITYVLALHRLGDTWEVTNKSELDT